MKTHFIIRRAGSLAALFFFFTALLPARASDHADPMSLNVFKLQKEPEANITDLHAFIVDKNGRPVTEGDPSVTSDQLIVSLCVRRALQPQQIAGLKLQGVKFRVHLDLQPPVRFFDEKKTREGAVYDVILAQLSAAIDARAAELAAARSSGDPAKIAAATAASQSALASRTTLVSQHEADRSAQALYGGIVTVPDAIAQSVLLEFGLDLAEDPDAGENSESKLTNVHIEGLPGQVNIVAPGKVAGGKTLIPASPFRAGAINVQTGIFDDPFIFPRFFRRNVVGIVTSIPLADLRAPARHGPIILWATSHSADGKQIDHVGRSLRTQLPRFGYLNDKHPAEHVREITRVHAMPTVLEDVLATFLAPLEAHRHYDSAPDVMIYDLTRPAKFPNGRWLEDDVSKILADAGETLLFELSYSESRQFPRATTNDKIFQTHFPYLAPRWTAKEIAAFAPAGITVNGFPVPRASDMAATAFLNLKPTTWHTLWLVAFGGLIILTVLLLATVRSNFARFVFLVIAAISLILLAPVRSPLLPPTDPAAMAQPAQKLTHLLLGIGLVGFLKISWIFSLGRRFGGPTRKPEPFPSGNQEVTEKDRPNATDSFDAIKKAVFGDPYYGDVWGASGRQPLPIYRQTVDSLLRGLFPLGGRLLLQAARRTVRSHTDLRWGKDSRGFRRLLHPMGICLTGTWKITGAPQVTHYTGHFAPGSEGRIIARYSTGGSSPYAGDRRSLALVGKIYPKESDPSQIPTEGPAHFLTQENLGSTVTESICDAVLTNSPPVSPLNRGKDLLFLLINGLTLLRGDTRNTERQLYEIAELGKPKNIPTSCPRFLRLTVAKDTPRPTSAGVDFREEILGRIHNPGQPQPARNLIFDIAVSDEGTKWRFGAEFLSGQEWTTIGQIAFDDAAASYNGDFVIHFHHPAWRKDRNDPETIRRRDLRS